MLSAAKISNDEKLFFSEGEVAEMSIEHQRFYRQLLTLPCWLNGVAGVR